MKQKNMNFYDITSQKYIVLILYKSSIFQARNILSRLAFYKSENEMF